MHRSFDSKDVIDYSTGARKRDIELRKKKTLSTETEFFNAHPVIHHLRFRTKMALLTHKVVRRRSFQMHFLLMARILWTYSYATLQQVKMELDARGA